MKWSSSCKLQYSLLLLVFIWGYFLAGHLPLTFRTPPVSPPRTTGFLTGMRRVCSLEFRPHVPSSPDSGLADPLLGAVGSSERSFLPQSTIYNWSCGRFSKPLLNVPDDIEEILARREEREKFALYHISECQHTCGSSHVLPLFSSSPSLICKVCCLTYFCVHYASAVRKLSNQPSWDTKFDTATKTALLHPFSPLVIAADENERIRYTKIALLKYK